MTDTTNDPARSTWVRRAVVFLVGAAFVVLGAISLGAQVVYSLNGTPQSGTIVETEGGIGKIRSVTARVEVTGATARPFTVEVEDVLGRQGWKEGDAIQVLCTHIHADHLSCIANLWFDRFVFGLIATALGLAALWLAVKWR